jgi:hypothetical protein
MRALLGRVGLAAVLAASRRLRRNAFTAAIRPDDVFIVAFPKSGTTWLAYMLSHLLTREIGGAMLSFSGMGQYVRDVNREYFARRSFSRVDRDSRFFTVHAPYDSALPNVVYVVRDPRDALVSYFHHQRLMVPGFDLDIAEFVTSLHGPLDWGGHVEGWLAGHHPSFLVVTYERLKCEPADVLREVANFSGLTPQEAAITQAVDASTFKRMRAMEERLGVPGAVEKREHFVRRGIVGGWRDELDAETAAIIEGRYGSTMEALGYELCMSRSGPSHRLPTR